MSSTKRINDMLKDNWNDINSNDRILEPEVSVRLKNEYDTLRQRLDKI
jgi:hypothetical protein